MLRPILAAALLLSAAATSAAIHPPSLLTPADLDPAQVLPPPPAADSVQAAAELAELHGMQQRRTSAEFAAARAEGERHDLGIFADALGGHIDPARLPATVRLFELVRATERDAATRGKAEFRRPRPWIVDPAVISCTRDDEPLSSYPSGHTTFAYAEAGVLARLVPSRAAALLARAAHYGEARIVCEQHFRSDVTAGQTLGLLVADRLFANLAFRYAFAAARRELTAAGVRQLGSGLIEPEDVGSGESDG